jgi:hypothetical protein
MDLQRNRFVSASIDARQGGGDRAPLMFEYLLETRRTP